ncbi:MAG: prolipoprotein diacylglyceryl transferase [Elusimicrobiota bacterium]
MLPVLFHLGPLKLHTYGLLVAMGFYLGFFWTQKEFHLRSLPLSLLETLLVGIVAFGLLGARVFYYLTTGHLELKTDPLSFFKIWEGGLVFYGGFIFVLLFLAIFSRLKKLPFLKIADAFVPGLFLGHALGRLGCFGSGCCYGKPSELPWAVMFKNIEALAPSFVRLHPTQLYEFFLNLIFFALAAVLSRRLKKTGLLSVFYLLGYALVRFTVEIFRGDDRGHFFFGFSPSQILSMLMIIFGMGMFIYVQRKSDN